VTAPDLGVTIRLLVPAPRIGGTRPPPVRLGADPALAAGPVATVVQDVLSVAIYLGLAASLL
jgi:Mg/Co/Ni transporter MgtE